MKDRSKRHPLLVPLTPVVVAAFFAARNTDVLPGVLLHAVYSLTFAVFVLGTYLMTFRDMRLRTDMARALSQTDQATGDQLLGVDVVTHWLPMAVVLYDTFWARRYGRPAVDPLSAGGVIAAVAATGVAYTSVVDTEYLYQMDDSSLLPSFVGSFAAYFLLVPACM